jgi:cell division protein FtsZ
MLHAADFVRRLGAEQLAAEPSERRMTRRLTEYWNALRDNNPYPARSAIRSEAVLGLREYGICIALNLDGPGPIYQMVGTKLKEMAGIDLSGKLVIDTPDDTLLAVAGEHYTEVLQHKGPVTLESEFIDNEGTVFLFRIFMLPCSEDGQHIDSIIGAITFKEKPSIKGKLAQATSPTAPEKIDVAAPQADIPIVAERKQSAGQTIDTHNPTAASKDDLAKSLREGQELALPCQAHENRSHTALYEPLEPACVPKIQSNLTPRIVVVGLGGAGGNAVDNMIRAKLEGVEFLIANTDAQALAQSQCERRVLLGQGVTRGLGAGSRPEVGRAATEDALHEVLSEIEGAHMVFIAAGMGGGTGTGGAPIIAQAAREAGILTVSVVTKPFHFEGARRMRFAEAGITELSKQGDTLIVIPNQNLLRVSDEKTTFADAFRVADEVLHSGVRGVSDLMVMPGLINLDFSDIQSVMAEMGKAIMSTGEAEGENRALEAAEAAISNPLLDEASMKGARMVLINITGGMDLTLFEVDQAANQIREEVDNEANIIFGSVIDQRIEGRMRVSVVATGIEADERAERPKAAPLNV